VKSTPVVRAAFEHYPDIEAVRIGEVLIKRIEGAEYSTAQKVPA